MLRLTFGGRVILGFILYGPCLLRTNIFYCWKTKKAFWCLLMQIHSTFWNSDPSSDTSVSRLHPAALWLACQFDGMLDHINRRAFIYTEQILPYIWFIYSTLILDRIISCLSSAVISFKMGIFPFSRRDDRWHLPRFRCSNSLAEKSLFRQVNYSATSNRTSCFNDYSYYHISP